MSPVRAAGSGACRPHPAVFAASLVKVYRAPWILRAMLSIASFSVGSESEVLPAQACTNRELNAPGRGCCSANDVRKELLAVQSAKTNSSLLKPPYFLMWYPRRPTAKQGKEDKRLCDLGQH